MVDELIQYPFKLYSKEDVILYRVKEDFEMRFTRELTAQRVVSACRKNSKKYVEIEIIDDGSIKILQHFEHIHIFKEPADFYLTISENSKYFYESLHLSLINPNLDSFLDKAKEIDEIIKKEGFPEIPIPITTSFSHFENFESATSKVDDSIVVPTVQLKYFDDIPCDVAKDSLDLIKTVLTAKQFELQDQFYKGFFTSNPIARFKTVTNYYENRDTVFKRAINLYMLKKCIGIHAYFLTSGPWRKCWVKFGYDPKASSENYKYQVIELRSKKASFQIFQRQEIVIEVTKNRDWYLLKTCDPIDGFVSKTLKNFIVYIIDNGEAKLINKKIEDLQDSDMEIFDM